MSGNYRLTAFPCFRHSRVTASPGFWHSQFTASPGLHTAIAGSLNRLFLQGEYSKRGYTEVITPNMYNHKLWITSGHWQNYAGKAFRLCH